MAADRGAVTTEVATTGTLQPVRTLSLSFAVAGTVEEIAVRPGSTVHPGQVLARVDDADAADAVDSAQEALSDAEDALTEAKSAGGRGRRSAHVSGRHAGRVPVGGSVVRAPRSGAPTHRRTVALAHLHREHPAGSRDRAAAATPSSAPSNGSTRRP